ncbi:GNAT family N-acetyltransferase [Photobacterium galatheae]|uniref:Acetyltransferase n=1 Tax=Photobacterium galatheae TaxID=1654360 RepID=A0A066RMR0_9GAMM|nr:GNAT family N-acetyltransferase [Photobacterium galatheae]KDM91634.1 acetyltransferase [Photobacterium galatheae]MCM0149708.1 GNAT family N-acetyltransferase [Photobacterium galatheae]
MDVSLRAIEIKKRQMLGNLFQFYLYELSAYLKWNPNDDGLFQFHSPSLNKYWEKDDHFPYFIMHGDELAGFALVRLYPETQSVHDIEQFFVFRKFKGQGVGRQALKHLVNAHPGQWQIRVLLENTPALKFWTSAVGRMTGERYTLTTDIDVDLLMYFIFFNVET